MEKRLKEILAELRDGLEKIYGARLVDLILYGSRAREDNTDESDIDVMVVLKDMAGLGEEIERVGDFQSKFCLKHEVVVSFVFRGEEAFLTRSEPLLRNVRREGIRI